MRGEGGRSVSVGAYAPKPVLRSEYLAAGDETKTGRCRERQRLRAQRWRVRRMRTAARRGQTVTFWCESVSATAVRGRGE